MLNLNVGVYVKQREHVWAFTGERGRGVFLQEQ